MSIPSLKLKVITNLSLLEKLTKQISKSRISRTHEEEKHKELLGWRQIPQRTKRRTSGMEIDPTKNKRKNLWDGDIDPRSITEPTKNIPNFWVGEIITDLKTE